MKRLTAILLLTTALWLPATATLASSFSWSIPGSAGSWSSDGSSSATTNGYLTVDSTTVNWSLNLGIGSISGSASAMVNGLEYAGTFDLSNLFSLLFW